MIFICPFRSSLHRHLQNEHGIDPSDLMDQKLDINIKTEYLENDEEQDHHMLAESMLESETVCAY